MDGTVQFVIPVAALLLIFNFVLTLMNRAKTNKIANGNGNVMLKLMNQVKEGQEDCQFCLNDVKVQVVLQTDVLKDIRDLIRKESKHGNE